MYSTLANFFMVAYLAEQSWDGVDIVEKFKRAFALGCFLEEARLLILFLKLLLWKSCFLFIENRVYN